MQNIFRIFFIFILISIIFLPSLYSQKLSYNYLMELGQEAFKEYYYQEALHYFKLAQLIHPDSDEPRFYMNLVKRTMDGRVVTKEEYDKQVKELIKDVTKSKTKKERVRRKKIKDILLALERKEKEIVKKMPVKEVTKIEKPFWKLDAALPKKVKKLVKKEEVLEILYLETASRDDFPLIIRLVPEKSFKIHSKTFKRFLIITPDVILVEKIDKSTIEVTGKNLGSSFLHVWDNQGRWTFKVKNIPPRILVETKKSWQEAQGFKFIYSGDWNSYYRGRRFGTMEKQTLTFDEWAGIVGPTPYGDLDVSVNWSRLNSNEEVTGYTVGINNGQIFNFKDIYIRGFDFTHSFSPLSFPGQLLKGFFFRSPAFNKTIEYSVMYGREKQYYYGSISPGIISQKDSFVEGLRLSLFPYGKNKFFFNYAHGYGSDRDDFLKDKVFSFQSEHLFDKLTIISEIASDENAIAASFSSVLRMPRLTLRASFRDTEKKFVTITGRPPNLGEIGGIVGFDWHPSQNLSFTSNIDIYRDKNLFNPSKARKANVNWDGSMNLRLDSESNITTNAYYINSPGLSAPQRSLNATTIYNRRFDFNFFGQRPINTYIGYNYQKSVNPLSPTSDYRRDGILSGLRLRLGGDLYYYLNHTYSWLKELSSNERAKPSVLDTGIDYYHTFNPLLSTNFRLNYRDEQNATSLHSFLSGEDSLEGSLNVTYSPKRGTEFFVDGRVRNVWAENADTDKFIEGELRLGARLSWDSFFSWAPKAKIEGLVFKDSNGDGIKADEEVGIEAIKIIVGPKEILTDSYGEFSTVVRAKSVIISIDINTIPKGYVLTTPASFDVDTSYGGMKVVNFGISPQSGVYGVVFFDVNDNGKLDKNDEPIPRVIVILDDKKKATSNAEGVYFFGDLSAGKHRLALDVNSLPLEYLPKISIRKEIDISEGLTYTYHIPLKKK